MPKVRHERHRRRTGHTGDNEKGKLTMSTKSKKSPEAMTPRRYKIEVSRLCGEIGGCYEHLDYITRFATRLGIKDDSVESWRITNKNTVDVMQYIEGLHQRTLRLMRHARRLSNDTCEHTCRLASEHDNNKTE